MCEIILAGFKFGDCSQNRQFTKLKTSPKFPAISYKCMGHGYRVRPNWYSGCDIHHVYVLSVCTLVYVKVVDKRYQHFTIMINLIITVRVEEFSFQNHFKSNRVEDQQILNRSTLPLALQEVYR